MHTCMHTCFCTQKKEKNALVTSFQEYYSHFLKTLQRRNCEYRTLELSYLRTIVFSIQHCTKISWRGRIELVGRIPARKRIFRKKGNPAYGDAAGMKHPASSQLTSYVVVVRVNGSHLIKNYLITFLALISGAWLSLARAPRLPRHRCHLLLPSLSLSLSLARTVRPHHDLLQPSLAFLDR